MLPAVLATTIAILVPRKRSPHQLKPKPNIQISFPYALGNEGEKLLLTAQEADVSAGDRIEVAGDVYRVEWVEYYLDPADMFIAQLVR